MNHDFLKLEKMTKIIRLIPLFLLFYLSLSTFDGQFEVSKFLSFNLQYIIIYYWVLKRPQLLGYGFIFLAGIINDVVLSNPIGLSVLTYLTVASMAAYIRTVTVRVSLFTDWVAFIPTVFVANFTYIIIVLFFEDLSIDYLVLLIGSINTIIAYPIFWLIFTFLWNSMRIKNV